jgi:hypothetical protein
VEDWATVGVDVDCNLGLQGRHIHHSLMKHDHGSEPHLMQRQLRQRMILGQYQGRKHIS